ncbi:MAG: MoxR family ATPase [Lentisphaeria bacterium]|nr:MoxR family ATPase [Lentisphaeria bacterium]
MNQNSSLHEKADAARRQVETVIRGKSAAVELLFTALFAGGHVLMDDVPGVGKTTLAKALAFTAGMEFSRIQFTPDLLPADIIGASVYSPKDGSFSFRRGPVFTQLLLADEINRASPRTQSALLEAMNERQVTVDGKVEKLAEPFLVIATENPVEYYGTFPLPEAQLDRFAVQLSLGYPDAESERALLLDRRKSDPLDGLQPVLTLDDLRRIAAEVREVAMEDSVTDYMLRIIQATREVPEFRLGASPRALLTLARCIQSCAWMDRRSFITPEDVRRMVHPVLAHRLILTLESKHAGLVPGEILDGILKKIRVPA